MITSSNKIQIRENNLDGRTRSRKAAPQDPYEKIAENYEAQFIQHMLKEMRKTVSKSDPEGAAMNYYNSILENERSRSMAKQGLGIKDMILKQIRPQALLNKPRDITIANKPKQLPAAYGRNFAPKERTNE